MKTEAGQQALKSVQPSEVRVPGNIVGWEEFWVVLVDPEHLSGIVHLLLVLVHLVELKSILYLRVLILHVNEFLPDIVDLLASVEVDLQLVLVKRKFVALDL